MKTIKQILKKAFSWIPICKALIGGYNYYNYTKRNAYSPSQFNHFGKNAEIHKCVSIIAPERCHIGEGSTIGSKSFINAIGGFRLGNFSGIAYEAHILTVEHRISGATYIPFDSVRFVKPVDIGDYVWIGAQCTILSGVKIGEGAIVGIGSVVTQDIPRLSIVSGNPAKVIGRRSEVSFNKLKEEGKIQDLRKYCEIFWVPQFSIRKHKELLEQVGFVTELGENFFIQKKGEKSISRFPNKELATFLKS